LVRRDLKKGAGAFGHLPPNRMTVAERIQGSGKVRFGTVRHVGVWRGAVRGSAAGFGSVRFGLVRRGMVRHGHGRAW
jgi:hypothetical protein